MTDIHHPENDSQYAWLTMNNNVAYPLNVNPSMQWGHLRAGAHGISSGVFSIINGGNFGSGFVAGAVSSSIGSVTQALFKNPYVITLSSGASGGITAWATGGSFLKGAIQGLKIGLFNHVLHMKPGEVYSDNAGRYVVQLQEVMCYAKAKRTSLLEIFFSDSYKNLDPIGFGITVLDGFGESMHENSQNSTVGSNGKFYFHTSNQRAFYGNQYVKTVRLTNVGRVLGKVVKPVGALYDAKNFVEAYSLDKQNASIYGKNNYYNTLKTLGGITFSWTFAFYGVKLGGLWGSSFYGIGAIPGAIIFGTLFGIAGSVYGNYIGEETIQSLYSK